MEKKTMTQEQQVKVVQEVIAKANKVVEETRALERMVRAAKGTRNDLKPRSPGEYFVGDEGPTPELLEAVKKLIAERPMTLQDLLDSTGARPNRIKGVLMRIQREHDGSEKPLVNLGTDARALWFLPDPEVLKRLSRARRLRRRLE